MNKTFRFRFSKNQQGQIVQAALAEDLQVLCNLGFAYGTARQYITFSRMAKRDEQKALKAFPRLSKEVTRQIVEAINQPGIIQNYRETIQANLKDIGIEEIFNILNTTQQLIDYLQLEPEKENQNA